MSFTHPLQASPSSPQEAFHKKLKIPSQAHDFGIWVISSKLFFTRMACTRSTPLKLESSLAASRSLKLDLILENNLKPRKEWLRGPGTDGTERGAGVGDGVLVDLFSLNTTGISAE
ncbi:hypothetical protein B0H14DRAFT_2579832 [Mycena olivaceomarginata]|nr:hypothetical protein B0H14DRAFT_2579832 [Mycena olivaceomarginata]